MTSAVQERSIVECWHCGNADALMCCAPTVAYYETQRYRLNADMIAALDKAQRKA
jgi:high-affinity nickel permease